MKLLGYFRNSVFSKALWGFMALNFLNISIDFDDQEKMNQSENLAFNDQETIIEFIIETLFGNEDAFAEHDEPDKENHTKKGKTNIDLLVYLLNFKEKENTKQHFTKKNTLFPDDDEDVLIAYKQVVSPPPKDLM